ncbi:MAG: anion permease [Clostridiaceae bacterium]
MTISFFDFFNQFISNPALFIIVIITLGVIFINGWTDAPNSIATSIATRAISPRNAIVLAAIFNTLGVIVMTSINSTVANTVFRLADFKGNPVESLTALCAALIAIVIWSVAAWKFGIPTSEGHALIAGISGAAVALQNGFSGIIWTEWVKVIYGLFLSLFMVIVLGFIITRITEALFKNMERRKTTSFFHKAQVGGAAAMSFMHGAQDGQKFMVIFMLGLFLANGSYGTAALNIPVWLMIVCSAVSAAGTSIGGYKIIKTIGLKMVKLEPYQGFSADAAAAASLLVSSLLGLPVSSTHTKTTAIIGVGISRKLSSVNWSLVKGIALTWIFTFPGCGLLGYLMTILFMKFI